MQTMTIPNHELNIIRNLNTQW